MAQVRDFNLRTGRVFIPVADTVSVMDPSESQDLTAAGPLTGRGTVGQIGPIGVIRQCKTTLKEGCYTITFTPASSKISLVSYVGTVRVENITGGNIRFSGDLYSNLRRFPPFGSTRADRIRLSAAETATSGSDSSVIPIYPRKRYVSYLKGTSAVLTGSALVTQPCPFVLNFDEFAYTQPTSGFSGSFGTTATRSLKYEMVTTSTPDHYTGTVFQGTTNIGTVVLQWVSPNFRRASLLIYNLPGSEDPPTSVPASGGSGTETFQTVFATVGWDLSVTFSGQIPLPASLTGVQDPNSCWSQANLATLMSTLPGYNPADLDTVWRANLMSVPGMLGCGRGQMFDTGAGNPDNIPREGAVTYSHDGYPSGDSSHFGVAQNGLQKDFPRSFLRSASHEVGHTFNQIHQEFEGGADNSIMTTTPSVADVLATQGKTFPTDIHLGFNSTVRRHLVHLPDPAVRPGAIDFFGSAVNSPQADEVYWPHDVNLALNLDKDQVALGEPMTASWTMSSEEGASVLVPEELDIESLTARVSVTGPSGKIVFLRPAEQKACVHNHLRPLGPNDSITGSTNVLWGRDGFAIETPGRHVMEVIVMWQVAGTWLSVSAEQYFWVTFPSSDQENRTAALLLHPEVGKAIAAPSAPASEVAISRLNEAAKNHPEHPAIQSLRRLGMSERLALP